MAEIERGIKIKRPENKKGGMMKNFRVRGSIYFAEHVNFNALAHIFAGLGIAWLVSLSWHYAIPPLVAGAIFLVASIAMHIHAYTHGEF